MLVRSEVENTTLCDLESIYNFFEYSIAYQEKHGYPVWKNYDKQAIIKDIENGNQYKIVCDSSTVMVFSVCYSDRIIWREYEQGDSLYLHRIVVNPAFKGQRLFGVIIDWSISHCIAKGLKNVRMDTWAANPTIIDYYQSFGFSIVENYTTPDSIELPFHNRKLPLTLLEYRIV